VCNTQFELADLFGVSRTTFDNWVSGRVSPPALACALFEILRVLAHNDIQLSRRILALPRAWQILEIVKLAQPFIDKRTATATSGGSGNAPTGRAVVAGLPPLD
jgi:transcriptional regulator with XRE-family HTH domain